MTCPDVERWKRGRETLPRSYKNHRIPNRGSFFSAPVLPPTVSKSIAHREMSIAVEIRDTSLVFGEVPGGTCCLHSMSLEQMVRVIDLILPWKSPWKWLGVHDGVNVGGRSEIGDRDCLISLR